MQQEGLDSENTNDINSTKNCGKNNNNKSRKKDYHPKTYNKSNCMNNKNIINDDFALQVKTEGKII